MTPTRGYLDAKIASGRSDLLRYEPGNSYKILLRIHIQQVFHPMSCRTLLLNSIGISFARRENSRIFEF